jgi:hypothetical protein
MTLARPMFPPRADTRRNFLSQAADVAAGSAVPATAPVAPTPAGAAPKPLPDEPKASPAFTAGRGDAIGGAA